MEKHIFYAKYANTPIKRRTEFLGYDFFDIGGQYLTLKMIHKEIEAIDDKIRDDVIRQEELLNIAEKYYHEKRHLKC